MTSVEGRDNIYLGSIFNWMSVNAMQLKMGAEVNVPDPRPRS